MSRKLLGLAAALALACGLCRVEARAQNAAGAAPGAKEIAVTFDDLPLNGPQFDAPRLREMTAKLLAVIKKHGVPAVGFVNESLLYVPGETEARIGVLRQWADAGVELGNHTFSHLGFKGASLAAYEDDFVRGDSVTRTLMKQKGGRVRYFRHPFLQMGETKELELMFESFIAERGYRIAPVTVDPMDWMVLAAYNKARREQSAEMLKRVSEEYLKFSEERLEFSERLAGRLFGRPIRHILLLHANELNADTFDGMVRMMKARGYRFVTLEEALADEAYKYPDKYVDNSHWLTLWAASKGVPFNPPSPSEFLQQNSR
ncbi:MAG TPA: polysaccharide deacetylase family protein [Pyrinomonadaceae bacterium]|nr:polysaccharide deacetylase family protein [Pyrinomonadaceae bacterium]